MASIAVLLTGVPALAQTVHPAAHHEPPTEPRPAEQAAVLSAEESSGIDRYYQQYLDFKQELQDRFGLQVSLDLSVIPQWVTPRSGGAVADFVYTPWISWSLFKDTSIGSGTFVFGFQQNQYITRQNGNALQTRAGLLALPSDWGSNAFDLYQFTYNHALPDSLRWLSVTVGQYSFGLYDQNEYAGNAQTSFLNYALAQDATQTYVSGDLGAYVQAAAPDREWAVAAGFQGATNLSGSGLSTNGIASGKLAYFVAVRTAPSALGGTYSLLCYRQPAVPAQSASQGISLNAVQSISANWALFLRANHASGLASTIETSVASGVVVSDPLQGRPLDQLGLGFAWNQTNLKAVGQPAHRSEFVTELYYNYAVFKGLKIGPDIQFYINPALAPGSGAAAVFTVRGTASF